jgi:phospho-N-acetylmuramoyl-pentapeptide-transferase
MNQFQDPNLILNVAKILILAAIAFLVTFTLTPVLTHFLYKYKLAKKIRNTGTTPVYTKMHIKKEGTPTMGGILIWMTTLVLAYLFFGLSKLSDNAFLEKLNFFSRGQTWLPLAALVACGLVGLLDDILNVRGLGSKAGGIQVRHKLLIYTAIAAVGAWWFFYKLGWDVIHIPAVGNFNIGFWYIPLFIFIMVATSFSVNESDGLDGLAGGIMMFSFGAYSVIAFAQGKMELAAFCGAIIGALLAFLWFNIYPARFFMGDTGSMALGTTLGIVAMLTNSVLVLPIIAFPLVLESASVIIQIISKRIFKKKIFLSTPIHHHFEAKGWPEPKVVMRFWIISAVSAAIGLVIGLLGGG